MGFPDKVNDGLLPSLAKRLSLAESTISAIKQLFNTTEKSANKNRASGYPSLDDSAKLNVNQFPALARQLKKDYLENTPELAILPIGGISDGLVPVTKNGALASATISKSGNFDSFQVTDGDNTSYIHMPNLKVCDNRATLKARIKVAAYKTNAALDCLLGIGYYGQQAASDTGTNTQFGVYFNLNAKTVSYFNNSSGTFGDVTASFKISSAFAVATGDVVEITLQRLPEADGFAASLINLTTGEFISGSWNTASSSRAIQVQNAHLKLYASNGTFTIYELKALASVPARPLLYVMGDSYASGDNNVNSTLFPSLMINDPTIPYYIVCGAGNGGAFNAMAQFQLQELMKLKPRYVLQMSILSVFYGYFNSGDANQTTFMNAFNNIMNGIVSYGGVPILVKWQNAGGFLGAHGTAWNTFVDTQVALFPTTKVLDLSAQALQFTVASHPNPSDHLKIKTQLVSLLQSIGAI